MFKSGCGAGEHDQRSCGASGRGFVPSG
jgi:hypothetical protein